MYFEEDLSNMVTEQLFNNIPGRQHKGFETILKNRKSNWEKSRQWLPKK